MSLDVHQVQVSILANDPTVAQALARILLAEGFAVRDWGCAREFMAQPERPPAGCLIANLSMPDMAGLEVQRELTARQWPLPVIFLTSPDDITTAVRGMKAGAINCLPRPVQRAELLEAVREAFSQSRAVHARRTMQLRVRQLLACLTPREREVLDLAVTGLVARQIAARLGTAEKTIKAHKGSVMRKMQVRSTFALVQLMLTARLSPLPWARHPVAQAGQSCGPQPCAAAAEAVAPERNMSAVSRYQLDGGRVAFPGMITRIGQALSSDPSPRHL